MRRITRPIAVVVALGAMLTVAGCTPDNTDPTPDPTPSVSSGPLHVGNRAAPTPEQAKPDPTPTPATSPTQVAGDWDGNGIVDTEQPVQEDPQERPQDDYAVPGAAGSLWAGLDPAARQAVAASVTQFVPLAVQGGSDEPRAARAARLAPFLLAGVDTPDPVPGLVHATAGSQFDAFQVKEIAETYCDPETVDSDAGSVTFACAVQVRIVVTAPGTSARTIKGVAHASIRLVPDADGALKVSRVALSA